MTVGDPSANIYTWTPSTGLSSTTIPDPVANLSAMAGQTITYTAKATTVDGCSGQDDIKVIVFALLLPIFLLLLHLHTNSDGPQ